MPKGDAEYMDFLIRGPSLFICEHCDSSFERTLIPSEDNPYLAANGPYVGHGVCLCSSCEGDWLAGKISTFKRKPGAR